MGFTQTILSGGKNNRRKGRFQPERNISEVEDKTGIKFDIKNG